MGGGSHWAGSEKQTLPALFVSRVVDFAAMRKTPIALTFAAVLAVISLSLIPYNREPESANIQVKVSTLTFAEELSRLDSVEQANKTAKVVASDNRGSATCFPIAVVGDLVAWLTCAHVVLQQPDFVILPNGDVMPIVKMAHHSTRDVGVIWTRTNPHVPVVPVPLATSIPTPGTRALHSGYPGGHVLWFSEGLLGSANEDGDIWASVPFYYGCSGGPVLVDGEAVGIAMAVFLHDGGFATVPITTITSVVPIVSVRDWIDEVLAAGANPK